MNLVVPAHTSATYRFGDTVTDICPGDILLVRHHGAVASGIRGAERVRKPKGLTWHEWWNYCAVNHACVAITGGQTAIVAQATGKGVVLSRLPEIGWYGLGVIRILAPDDQLTNLVAFAYDSVGTGYGWLQIPADLVNAATGLELSLGIGGRMVCSTQTTRAAERTSFIADRDPGAVTPAHISYYFGVKVPKV